MLSKNLAGSLAFFFGMFGAHRFYLGQPVRGTLQFAGFFAAIALVVEAGGDPMPLPLILAAFVLAPIITGLVFWTIPYERWAAKYDPEALVARGYPAPAKPRQPWIRRAAPAEVAAAGRKGVGGKPDLRALKAEGVKYYRSGDFDLAVEAFLEASALAPADPVAHFNLACCYALLGQFPDALRQLEYSVTYELPGPERIEQHPALRELRESELYRKFRANNFRRLDLVALGDLPPAAAAAPESEILEDFATPPRSEGSQERAAGQSELLEQLGRLQELRDAGILTEREYGAQREKLMG